MADRTVEIVINLSDQTSGKLNGLKNSLASIDKTAQKLNAKLKSFANQKYQTTLQLIDRVTSPASKINSLLKKIAGGVYNITMRLNDGALSGIRKIETSLMKLTSKAYNIAVNVKGAAGKKLEGLLSGAAMGAGVMAPFGAMAGAGFGVANAIQSSAAFERTMSKVQAIRQLDKNSDEMKRLTEQAKELGMTTAWTRQQVGEAQYYASLAGWKTEEILAATPSIVNLASAGDMDLGAASDLITDAMTAFGLKASDKFVNKKGQAINAAEYFADMLAKVQASSNTDLYQLRESLKYGAPTIGAMFANVKGQEGVQQRMEAARQLMIMQGAMANAGIKGSMSGTGINTLFSRLAGGTRGAVFAERLLGLEHAQDGQMLMPLDFIKGFQKKAREGINVEDFYQLVEEFSGEKIHADTRRKLDSLLEHGIKNGGKLGSEDIIKLSNMMAGVENAPKLMAMLFQDIESLESAMNNVEGTAGGMANDMLDNLAGSFVYLQSAWDAFQQDLFTGTAGDGLRNFVDTLTEIITKANNLFKDGIDIKDFGAIIGDVIDRLKNKFLELDGIGSILAGGALALGLKKIVSLTQSAVGSFKNLRGTQGINAAQKIGAMNITAGVVNVNGKVSGVGKVGNQTIIDNYNRTKERIRGTPPATSTFSNARGAAGSAAVFAGLFGVLDILNVKAQNAERLAQAPPELKSQVLQENRQAEAQVVAQTAGGVFGAAAGAALGSALGPVGTMFGGIVGGMIGQVLGDKAAEVARRFDNSKDGLNEALTDKIIQKHLNPPKPDYSFGQTQKSFDDFSQLDLSWQGKNLPKVQVEIETEDLRAKLDAETQAWKQSMTMSDLTEQFTSQFATPSTPIELPKPDTETYFADLNSQMAAGFSQIPPIAQSNLEGVTTAFTTSKDQSQAAWSETPSFFSGIFSGLGGAAQAAGAAIYSGLTSVIGSIIGAWEGAASTISGIISNISSFGSSVSASVSGVIARVRGHAEGGFVTSPELSMIGEDGSEVVIPLSPEKRGRALDLFAQTGAVLGASQEQPSNSNNVVVNATFNISGNIEEASAQAEEKLKELADKVAGIFAGTLADAHANRTLA